MRNLKVNNRNGSFALVYPSTTGVNHYILTGGTAKSITVPTGAKYVVFSCTENFYVAYTGTAIVPSVDVTNGTGNELNPTVRDIKGLTSISAISASGAILTVAFYTE